MKFMCLGYAEEKQWDTMPKNELDALIDECFSYDETLLKNGHWLAGGQALQTTPTAKILRWRDGKVLVTDGPYAETKEQLGGVGMLEARDMNHAVELMSLHPGVRVGPFEIRPVNEEALERQEASKVPPVANPNANSQKFACIGYIAEEGWSHSPQEFETMVAECIAFDEARRRSGQWLSGIALQGSATAKTLRSKAGKVIVTDGPYAETKEQLGGLVVLALPDMNSAVELISTHPALRYGVVIEVRPIDEETNAKWERRKSSNS